MLRDFILLMKAKLGGCCTVNSIKGDGFRALGWGLKPTSSWDVKCIPSVSIG